ncbi:MAG: MurR/RpiR family transcriptional regulator [Burkholderiales bacterium]|nr:MurR/RpiR family transcriptional regulator [Burkholderiales bacterium]
MPRPSTFEAFTEAVAAAYDRLSPQQQQIAQFVLEHPDRLALGTVATVAEAVAVQPSALIRFANALEFGGFTEMQQVFRSRLLERSSSYRERIAALRQHPQPGAAPGTGVLHQFVTQGVSELSHLEDNVRAEDLAAAAALICRAARVHVLAQRRAFPVAAYLAYALAQLDVKARLLEGVGGMLGDVLRQIGSDELLLVTSFKNYSPEVIAAAEGAHARGVPVVAITDFALSPLKPHARICFEIGAGADATFRSLVGPMCLAQALVVGVGHRLVAPARKATRLNGKGRKA